MSSGNFNTNLHTIAANTGAAGLATATSLTPVIVNISPTFAPTYMPGAPTPSPRQPTFRPNRSPTRPTFQPSVSPTKPSIVSTAKNNSTAIIASIVVVVFVIGIAGAFYYRYRLNKKSTVQISVDANTENPMAHRISVMDGKMPATDSEINLSPLKKTGSN